MSDKCGKPLGGNIMMSGRLFFLPQQADDLIVEVRNSELTFRFWGLFLEPWSDQIDVEGIEIRRPGTESDAKLLQGDPVNILQIMNEGRMANGPFLMEALDNVERKTDMVFNIRNNEAIQGVTVTICAIGQFGIPPSLPVERVIYTNQDPGAIEENQRLVDRRMIQPQQGPIQGVRGPGNGY